MSVIRSITRDLLGSLTRNIIVETIASAAAAILDSLQTESNGMVLHFESDTALVRDTGTPANDYNDSFNTEAADFLTYTSPSPKMVLQADGTLKYAAHNLYLNSGIPATQNITVVSGHPYKLIVTGTTSITVSGAGTGTATAGSPVTFSAGTTTATLTLNSGTGTAQFFKTPASETYLETTGSARYALPIEYDSAGVSKGVLSEPAATNLIPVSNDLTDVAWTEGGLTITTDNAVGPSGNIDFDRLEITDTTNEFHGIYDQVVFSTATDYTLSSVVKSDEQQYVSLLLRGTSEHFVWANFDIQNGALADTQVGDISGTIAGTSIEALGNGFYRISLTGQVSTAPSPIQVVSFHNAAEPVLGSFGVQDYVGVGGDGLWLGDIQFELGSVPTSYIPTYGSTVTRARDDLSLAAAAWPYSDTAGSIIVKTTILDDASLIRVFQLYKDSSNYIEVRPSSTAQFNIYDTGVFQAALQPGPSSVGTEFTIAGSWAANDFASSIDGSAVATDVSGTVPSGLTALWFGRKSSTASYHGHLKYFKYLPRAIEDAELITDTTA